MKLNVIGNDIVNIEGLTFRQLALVEKAIRNASKEGGYKIDIDDLNLVMDGFNTVDIKRDFFNLEKEKVKIEASCKEIMKNCK